MSFEQKTKSLQDAIKSLANNQDAFEQGNLTCAICGKDATEFKDALSKKEYGISKMCQECQDETFDS